MDVMFIEASPAPAKRALNLMGKNVIFEDLNKVKEIEGYIGLANTLVKYDDRYTNIVLNQLGNVLVVDNIVW